MHTMPSPLAASEPPFDCPRCPRLVALRHDLRAQHPDWWNAPVPAFGDPQAWLAIVGLAPGMKGANRTGRAFIGDGAGALLYGTLAKFGLAHGTFTGSRDDDIVLDGAIILNAVKCLPPGNAPLPEEVRTCRAFLSSQADALPAARVFIALGQVAHQSVVKVLGGKLPKARFAHGAVHRVPDGRVLIDSYHCSRYNQNTGRLTAEMFDGVFATALSLRP